ncbi:Bud site selection protein BUD4 [Apiospora rasikravindrae]|uniref:Bud site selection protein BUD4 n=1 Tax=Apiospora rasikravindrae TaxID=990691 RepID=A0ABR1RWM1_9PEZI
MNPLHQITQPLRISKGSGTPSTTPNKSGLPRPLSEISVGEKRRNSPSWNQTTKVGGRSQAAPVIPRANHSEKYPKLTQVALLQKMGLNTDSSPFQSSPLDNTSSPRLFWQSRNTQENDLYGGGSPSPTRRSSIERLQKASRVKNSTMFAREQKQEYDPTRIPTIERPLAKVSNSAYVSNPAGGFRSSHGRSDSQSSIPLYSPGRSIVSPVTLTSPTPLSPRSPSKDQVSPMKSSLSNHRFKSSHDSQPTDYFDLSSIGTNSREGSYDSEEEDDDEDAYGLYRDEGDLHEDSFDATLEDTDKTPVVGPDEWRGDSCEERFENSPLPEGAPSPAETARPQHGHGRTDSTASSGEHRPLPPLPGMGHVRTQSNSSSNGLSATAERMLGSPRRDLPTPPPAATSKSEMQNIGNTKMSLEERLKLMMLSEDTSPKAISTDPIKSFAEQQRERRMRRAGPRDRVESPTPDDNDDAADSEAAESEAGDEAGDEDDTIGDISGLDMDYQLPSISRQSILQRVNGNKAFERDSDFHFNSSPAPSSPERQLPFNPDVPIDSIEESVLEDVAEESESSVILNGTEDEKSDVYDLYQRSEDDQSEIDDTLKDDDSESHYSDGEAQRPHQEDDEDSVMTPRAGSSGEKLSPAADSGITNFSATLPQVNGNKQESEFTRSLQSFMLPKPKEADAFTYTESHKPKEDIDDLTHAEAEDHKQDQDDDGFSYTESHDTDDDDVSSYTESQVTEDAEDEAEDEAAAEAEAKSESQGRPTTPEKKPVPKLLPKTDYDGSGWGSKADYDGSGWGEPEEEEEIEEPGTPESVIHHPVSEDEYTEDEEEEEEDDEEMPDEPLESPEVPERVATIKSASGSKLKTRPSATPSDLAAMREARRHVSREVPPSIPPIPSRHKSRSSTDVGEEKADNEEGNGEEEDFIDRHPSFKKRSLTLDLDLGLSLDQDFERVIEQQKVQLQQHFFKHEFLAASNSPTRQASRTQNMVVATDRTPGRTPGRKLSNKETHLNANITNRKQRGYLMRQNTKVVTASDKQSEEARDATRSAGNSPVKQTARPQSWTVEPWNGRPRQRSTRKRTTPSMNGPVPPMPGQESNATTALNNVPEEDAAHPELATEECGERGRLFVKVMGVKDLDLPLPRNERTWFSLTLDNGVHCVTTAWLELARNAPIGQEFELVVPNDLEFQLTLNVKLEKPPEPQRLPASPTKMSKPKTSTFSRVFASPKKRKEMEARMRAEEEAFAQAQRDAATRQRKVAPTAWDLMSPLAADDGSFARSYVCLKEHETHCYGRPYMVEIAAFNEWAVEEAGFASSVKSKRGGPSNSVVRRAPYKIGKLEVQLLFVPRAKGSTDEDMPKSMNSAIRELKASEERLSRNWEGPLSQQGGDCPYWRRRYFKLVGTKLTAYHEATRQPRATINLSNAKRIIDDRRQLTQPDTTGKGGKRRRSAFAEEEEGYMFVEEGFRVRFNNGEVIDFYADTAEDKDGWMKVLGDVVGREGVEDDTMHGGNRRKWCELVLKREEALRKKAEGRRTHSKSKSMIV